MTDDFDAMFGGRPRPTFADRVGREQPATPPPMESAVGAGPYKPYGFLPSGVGEACDVQRWLDGTEVAEGIEFQYRFLMQIGYVGEEQIKLFLPDCIVVIEGRQLRDLRKRLARRQVTFIAQYNPRVWPTPPAGEPIVMSIELMRP
ncbi:hypothetical protein [Caulobacter mirabilis]|uniref:Uncharacterized protein n=1 Tax=Caulobacter mirabilis TaxID=69666 RepID=A0A2D2AYP9_9CAUL|nr:hypothetical protein [Caulobacter mirabilis]ATQ43123.1 hypothetical protein CSW64_12210 [Caulobacter mirabilis]